MRGLKSLAILVVVLAGLGAYIHFVESKKPAGGETGGGPKVFSVKADAIDELTVKAANGDRTTLKKNNGTWQITAPMAAPAEEAQVSGIVTNLASLENERTIEENPKDLAPFGLAEPRVEVAFRSAGGKEQRLLVGDKTATQSSLYAKLPGEKKVFLISSSFDATFNRNTFDLRDKSILAFDRDKVDRLEIQHDTTAAALVRAGNEWKIERPVQAPADYGTVEGLIGRVQTAQMKGITAQEAADLKAYGLDKPVATFTAGLGSSRATLLIGGPAETGAVYAKDASRPMIFTVESSLLDELKKPADDLRRKDLFEFRPFSATAIEIAREKETFAFEKTKGPGKDAEEKWRQTKPAARDVDSSAMETLLSKLSNLRAQSFVETGPKVKTGLESPAMVVSVKLDSGNKSERVSFGRAGNDAFASPAGQPGAAKIAAADLDEAVKALDAVMAAPPAAAAPAAKK
jgi:hypothetical protein